MDNEINEIKVTCKYLFALKIPFSLQVNVPLNEIEFLNLDDVESKQERSFLLDCVRSKEGVIYSVT